MALSDDARAAWKKQGMGGLARETAMLAVLPDWRTIGQALDEGEDWRRWGKDLAEPSLRALRSMNPDDMAAAIAAIQRWDAGQ